MPEEKITLKITIMKFWNSIVKYFKDKRTFIGNFFRSDSRESMMRLCTFLLVTSGIAIIAMAVYLDKSGAHYGLELAVLGIIGKSYQKGQETKSLPSKKEEIFEK